MPMPNLKLTCPAHSAAAPHESVVRNIISSRRMRFHGFGEFHRSHICNTVHGIIQTNGHDISHIVIRDCDVCDSSHHDRSGLTYRSSNPSLEPNFHGKQHYTTQLGLVYWRCCLPLKSHKGLPTLKQQTYDTLHIVEPLGQYLFAILYSMNYYHTMHSMVVECID